MKPTLPLLNTRTRTRTHADSLMKMYFSFFVFLSLPLALLAAPLPHWKGSSALSPSRLTMSMSSLQQTKALGGVFLPSRYTGIRNMTRKQFQEVPVESMMYRAGDRVEKNKGKEEGDSEIVDRELESEMCYQTFSTVALLPSNRTEAFRFQSCRLWLNQSQNETVNDKVKSKDQDQNQELKSDWIQVSVGPRPCVNRKHFCSYQIMCFFPCNEIADLQQQSTASISKKVQSPAKQEQDLDLINADFRDFSMRLESEVEVENGRSFRRKETIRVPSDDPIVESRFVRGPRLYACVPPMFKDINGPNVAHWIRFMHDIHNVTFFRIYAGIHVMNPALNVGVLEKSLNRKGNHVHVEIVQLHSEMIEANAFYHGQHIALDDCFNRFANNKDGYISFIDLDEFPILYPQKNDLKKTQTQDSSSIKSVINGDASYALAPQYNLSFSLYQVLHDVMEKNQSIAQIRMYRRHMSHLECKNAPNSDYIPSICTGCMYQGCVFDSLEQGKAFIKIDRILKPDVHFSVEQRYKTHVAVPWQDGIIFHYKALATTLSPCLRKFHNAFPVASSK